MDEIMRKLQALQNRGEDWARDMDAALEVLAEKAHAAALDAAERDTDEAARALVAEKRIAEWRGALATYGNRAGWFGAGFMQSVRDYFEPAPVAARKGGRK